MSAGCTLSFLSSPCIRQYVRTVRSDHSTYQWRPGRGGPGGAPTHLPLYDMVRLYCACACARSITYCHLPPPPPPPPLVESAEGGQLFINNAPFSEILDPPPGLCTRQGGGGGRRSRVCPPCHKVARPPLIHTDTCVGYCR